VQNRKVCEQKSATTHTLYRCEQFKNEDTSVEYILKLQYSRTDFHPMDIAVLEHVYKSKLYSE
jgi:hypothetical protein